MPIAEIVRFPEKHLDLNQKMMATMTVVQVLHRAVETRQFYRQWSAFAKTAMPATGIGYHQHHMNEAFAMKDLG